MKNRKLSSPPIAFLIIFSVAGSGGVTTIVELDVRPVARSVALTENVSGREESVKGESIDVKL